MWRRDERGQSLAIMAISITVLVAMVGVAVDIGHVYAEKHKVQRAVDAASLAGIQDFPDVSAGIATAIQYVNVNEPGVSATASRVGTEKKLRVTGTKVVPLFFLKVIGHNSMNVQATAVSGFDGELDVVLNMDSTISMDGTPLADAKTAAHSFVDVLLPDYSGGTKIGLAPYNYCYNPPGNITSGYFPCIPVGKVVGLTDNASTIHSGINGLTATGMTNTCEGLLKAKDTVLGAGARGGPDTFRIVVLLADGDNNVQNRANAKPSAACNPDGDMASIGLCNDPAEESVQAKANEQTYLMAESMKAADIEIYVVGFGVCGTNSSATCNSGIVGQPRGDSISDRNLLKCVASSKTGTNDHYFEAASSSELDAIFRKIAQAIVTRLIE